jgi:hypothetical protein
MTFTDSNTSGQTILNAPAKRGSKSAPMVRGAPPYEGELLDDELRPARWAIRANVAGLKGPVTQ